MILLSFGRAPTNSKLLPAVDGEKVTGVHVSKQASQFFSSLSPALTSKDIDKIFLHN